MDHAAFLASSLAIAAPDPCPPSRRGVKNPRSFPSDNRGEAGVRKVLPGKASSLELVSGHRSRGSSDDTFAQRVSREITWPRLGIGARLPVLVIASL
jgi:hypothetical protein